MITFLGFLLGLALGVLITMVSIGKVVGWIDAIVKEERELFRKPKEGKLES